jgi:hypothetical protein
MDVGIRTLSEQELNVWSPSKQVQFGALGMTEDGRLFRYVSLGGTSTVAPGLILMSAVTKANAQALTITAVGTGTQSATNLTAGSRQIVITNSSTAVTQDEFAEGFLEITQTSGSNEGPVSYRVSGNSAAAASTGYIIVNLAEPLRNPETLVSGTDTASLWISPYSGVIATTTMNIPVGVTVTQGVNSSTVTNYGWVQCYGPCVASGDASSKVIGNTISASTTTAGYVSLAVTTTQPPIGFSRTTATTGTNSIFLNLD